MFYSPCLVSGESCHHPLCSTNCNALDKNLALFAVCDPDASRYLCHHIAISEAQAMFYFYFFPLLFEPELE